jgi:ankyrin repeat protein
MNQEELNEQFKKAAKESDLELVQYLVEQGLDIHADNDCALIWSAGKGYLEIVKYLVEKGADIHANDDEVLRVASEIGHLEIVKYLVEKGADIHAVKDTPLRFSASFGYLEVVKYLIENGADIHAENDDAFKMAALNNRLEVVKYFLFDCKMKIKQYTKDWLIKYNKKETLELIEKRDNIIQNYQKLKNLKNNGLVDKLVKNVKI